MQQRIKDVGTLELVKDTNRRYDEQCALHARLVLQRFVEASGSQEKAAKALGVDQGTVARSLAVDKQPSLRTLIALSRTTHQSLDAILGLEVVPMVDVSAIAEMVANEVQKRLHRGPSSTPPKSEPRSSSRPKK